MFKKKHPHTGAQPGTLVIPEDAPPPIVKVIRYNEAAVEEFDVDDVDQLSDLLLDDFICWVDVQGFGDEEAIREIAALFGMHPLMLEDVINVPHRPKVEPYQDQLLYILRMVRLDEPGHIDTQQLSIVFGNKYLVTFQEHYSDVLDPVRARLLASSGPMRLRGTDYLGYVIADTIVDAYYPVLEEIGEQLESLEDEVIFNPTPQLLQRLNRRKNRLSALRRAVWPQREAINSLVRGDSPLIDDEVRMFLRDTYDHCVQVADVIEQYREAITSLMSTYLSSTANRTNEIMRVLTIVATVFVPLTFIVGVYGMNFEYMPELGSRTAYPILLAVMGVAAVGMVLFFRHKGWIGRRRNR